MAGRQGGDRNEVYRRWTRVEGRRWLWGSWSRGCAQPTRKPGGGVEFMSTPSTPHADIAPGPPPPNPPSIEAHSPCPTARSTTRTLPPPSLSPPSRSTVFVYISRRVRGSVVVGRWGMVTGSTGVVPARPTTPGVAAELASRIGRHGMRCTTRGDRVCPLACRPVVGRAPHCPGGGTIATTATTASRGGCVARPPRRPRPLPPSLPPSCPLPMPEPLLVATLHAAHTHRVLAGRVSPGRRGGGGRPGRRERCSSRPQLRPWSLSLAERRHFQTLFLFHTRAATQQINKAASVRNRGQKGAPRHAAPDQRCFTGPPARCRQVVKSHEHLLTPRDLESAMPAMSTPAAKAQRPALSGSVIPK